MTTRALVVYCHPDHESFVRTVRDRVVATLEARHAEVRVDDLYTDGFDPTFTATEHRGTSNGEPIRRCRRTSTISCGATRSCSCTDVVVGSAGDAQGMIDRCGSTGWRGPCLPGRPARTTTHQRAPPRRRHHARVVEMDQHDRRRERQAHTHAQPPLDVPPARPNVLVRDVRRRHVEPGAAGALPRSCRAPDPPGPTDTDTAVASIGRDVTNVPCAMSHPRANIVARVDRTRGVPPDDVGYRHTSP